MLETMRSSTFRLRMPHRLPLPSAFLGCVFGSYSCWNTALRAQSLKGGDHALLQYVTVHVGIHGFPQ